jgi:hypothetical protein
MRWIALPPRMKNVDIRDAPESINNSVCRMSDCGLNEWINKKAILRQTPSLSEEGIFWRSKSGLTSLNVRSRGSVDPSFGDSPAALIIASSWSFSRSIESELLSRLRLRNAKRVGPVSNGVESRWLGFLSFKEGSELESVLASTSSVATRVCRFGREGLGQREKQTPIQRSELLQFICSDLFW